MTTQEQKDSTLLETLPTTTKAVVHGISLAISCFVTGELVFQGYRRLTDIYDVNVLLGVMWATVATVFVQQLTRSATLKSVVSRVVATCVSFVLCLTYLLLLPFHIWGLALLLGLGTTVTVLIGRPNEIVTTGITTSVVMVVAAMSPHRGWEQPLLRMMDTGIGVTVGGVAGWIEGGILLRHYSARRKS